MGFISLSHPCELKRMKEGIYGSINGVVVGSEWRRE